MNAELSSALIEPSTLSSRQFASSVLSGQGVAKIIAAHYELGGNVTSTLFRRLVNDTYTLTAGQRRFFLKVYNGRVRTREAIDEELTAITHLNAKGVRVAAPVPRRDGALITDLSVPEGLRHAVIFDWVSAQQPECNDAAHLIEIGRSLAALHLATEDLPASRARPRADFTHLFERPLAIIRPRLRSFPQLLERFDTIAAIASHEIELAREDLHDTGFCHGDYDPTNMGIDGRDVYAFDFDWCGTGYRIYDLATFKFTGLTLGVTYATMQPLVEGYLQVRPAAADSMRFLPLFALLRIIWLLEQIVFLSSCIGSHLLTGKNLEHKVRLCEQAAALLPARADLLQRAGAR